MFMKLMIDYTKCFMCFEVDRSIFRLIKCKHFRGVTLKRLYGLWLPYGILSLLTSLTRTFSKKTGKSQLFYLVQFSDHINRNFVSSAICSLNVKSKYLSKRHLLILWCLCLQIGSTINTKLYYLGT